MMLHSRWETWEEERINIEVIGPANRFAQPSMISMQLELAKILYDIIKLCAFWPFLALLIIFNTHVQTEYTGPVYVIYVQRISGPLLNFDLE